MSKTRLTKPKPKAEAKQAEEELLISLIDEIDTEVANLSKKRGEKAKKDLEKQLERKARAEKDLTDVRTELARLRGEGVDGTETGVGEEIGTGEEGVAQEGVEGDVKVEPDTEVEDVKVEADKTNVSQQQGKDKADVGDMNVLYSNQFRNLPVIDDTDTDAMLTYEAEGMPNGLEKDSVPMDMRGKVDGLTDKGYLYYNNGMYYLTPKGAEVVNAIESSKATDVKSVSVSSLSTDEARFQNREGLDQQKVDSIARNWNDAKQDPIHTWKDPKNGKTYVLSGHHRLAAAKKAGRTNVKTVDMSGMSEAEAVQFATVEANANRTMEKPSERAKVYRKMVGNGKTKKEVRELAEELEGKNAPYVLRLASLNPNGRVMELVRQAEASGDKAIQKEAELIADWIGDARSKYDLTDQHETELFEALLDKGFRQRVTKKTDFLQKVYSIAGAMDYNKGNPLNIRRFKNETEGERAYDEIRGKIVAKISELQDKIADIKSRFTDTTRVDYIPTEQADYDQVKSQADARISELNTQLKAEQKRLEQHQRDKGKFTRAQSTGSLFDLGENTLGGAIASAKALDQAFKAGIDLSESVEDNIQEMEDKGIIKKDCN
jgi:ParB-like chromosome segregation protein Spo0J